MNPADDTSLDPEAQGPRASPRAETAGVPPDLDEMRRRRGALLATLRAARPRDFAVRVVGAYELVETLGAGGMGVVYKARQPGLDRFVAVKMMHGPAGAEERARFRREAEAVSRLNHPNIVQIHGVGEHAGEPYIVLEYIAGGTLKDFLGKTLPPPGEAAALLETLARALHHAHEAGIVHRDLKPANVLLRLRGAPPGPPALADYEPKVADFGLARRLDRTALTRTGALLGTAEYMAPEQAAYQGGAVGPAADVYALGVILYECLAGHPPFRSPSVVDTLWLTLFEDPVPPRRLNPRVPRDLETICLKCLRKAPTHRYRSALELAEDLARFRQGAPIRARPVSWFERAWRWVRSHRAVTSLALLVLLSVAAGSGAAAWFGLDAREQARIAAQEAENAAQEAKNATRSAAEEQVARRHAQASERDARGTQHCLQLALIQQALHGGDVATANHLFGQTHAEFADSAEQYHLLDWKHRLYAVRPSGLDQPIEEMAWSPDGRHLATAGTDSITVWDASWNRLRTLPGPCFAWSPSGDLLATGCPDKTVKLWDPASGELRGTLRGHVALVKSVAFSPDGKALVSAGADQTMRVWDVAQLREQTVWRSTATNAVGWNSVGTRIVAGGDNAILKVWEPSGREVRTIDAYKLKAPQGPLRLIWHPDGKRLIRTHVGTPPVVVDVETGQVALRLEGDPPVGRAAAWSSDGRYLAGNVGSKMLHIWDAESGKLLRKLRADPIDLRCLVWMPGDRAVLVGCETTLCVWSLDAAEHSTFAVPAVNTRVDWCPDGRQVRIARDNRVALLDVETGRETQTESALSSATGDIVRSRDGTRVAVRVTGAFRLCDATTGQQVGELIMPVIPNWKRTGSWLVSNDPNKPKRRRLAWGPNDQRIVACTGDAPLRMWDVASGTQLPGLVGHKYEASDVTWSGNGKYIASAGQGGDRCVILWDADTRAELARIPTPERGFGEFAFNPGSDLLAAGFRDNSLHLYRVPSGEEVCCLQGHDGPVTGVSWSPDGRRLASASDDFTVRVWDAEAGREMLVLKGHTQPISSVAWSPTGDRLASVAPDGTLRVWSGFGPK